MSTKSIRKIDLEDFDKLMKNLPFAKLVLRDTKTDQIIFACHHEEDSRIWWPDGKTGRLGKLAHNTIIEAMKDKGGNWVSTTGFFKPTPESNAPLEKLSKERSTPVNRRSVNMVNAVKAQELLDKIKADKAIPKKVEEVQSKPLSDDFVSLRTLARGNLKGQATFGHFLTVRKNGKFIFSKEMRGVLTKFDIEISASTQKVRVCPGKGEYNINKSGCYCSKGAVEMLKFLEGETGRRVYLELSSDGYWYGDFSKSTPTFRR